ncbi:SH3 domain-containing protein [Nostoc parmelioides]|uniref:SH3 domain-containing protein n=1 Tax=Nostoc parmelioides FACHB-3921 TaxID=2692909 RepID=A0ABR8BP64_9NOSO|nr:SH3 domain-containing protein [Nostoc parmelioides]MBD2255902.1 SH3 domain-containing protein [Nostoc parmelioides FACHB-3921]
MKTQIKDFIWKHPKTSAAIVLFLVVFSFSLANIGKSKPPQNQISTTSRATDDDLPEETEFDSSKCMVYTVGILSGAIVHKFKTTNNSFAYVMVTNSDSIVRMFEGKNFYVWKTKEDFIQTEYSELTQVLPPEGVKELKRLISIYSYAAIGLEEFANVAAKNPVFDSNKCAVDDNSKSQLIPPSTETTPSKTSESQVQSDISTIQHPSSTRIVQAGDGYANLRTQASTEVATIMKIPNGTSVSIISEQRNSSGQLWYQVEVNGKVGWLYSELLSTSP